ncbi:MAG: 3-isopropylmalate dehydrogenase [Spirochaetes bacterium]|uniref:3-isopropylmalate dehydrogenase n=1 Tax=Candidatus Aphodenecus pullistercoris TaxID=2840669 RepID=A0A9D9HAG5_9SPIR|nr:3-isopropylmalate dehydrogenase [Candidatus Aphodenecus pullistercoris]
MKLEIALIPGDGIGPDIVREAVKVLQTVCDKAGHSLKTKSLLAGGAAIDATGKPLPEETLEEAKASQSVLLGAVGGPKWDAVPGELRPEKALLGLRGGLGLFCNLRPALLYSQLADACPLRRESVEGGLDIMVVRELTGGIYFGERGRTADGAYDTMSYTKGEVERIARKAFEIAMKRSKRLTSVDKANILETSRLWRATVDEVARDYPEVAVNHLYVDNAAMQLVRNPRQFDVILTENMFGDILSDEASMVTGSIGMLPSASLRADSFGMYEPIHGSAPDIAGQDKANPLATVLSVAMMLRYSLGMGEEASLVEKAVDKVLDEGLRTADIYTEGTKLCGTRAMGDALVQAVKEA